MGLTTGRDNKMAQRFYERNSYIRNNGSSIQQLHKEQSAA